MADAADPCGSSTTLHRQDILVHFSQRALSEAVDLIDGLLEAFGDHLHTRIVAADKHSASVDHETAYNLVQGQRGALHSSILANLEAVAWGAPDPQVMDPHYKANALLNDPQLDLVGVHDFEDRLAIERASRVADARYALAVESLTLRLAELERCDPLTVSLPVFMREICMALRSACLQHDIPRPVVPLLCDFLVEWGELALAAIYARLNQYLSQQGIRPDIEQELTTKGSVLTPLRQPSTESQHGETSPQVGIGATTAAGCEAQELSTKKQTPVANPGALYTAVMTAPYNSSAARSPTRDTGLLSAQGSHTTGATNPPSTLDTETLAQLLHQLQQDRTVREELACDAILGGCLDGYLARLDSNEPQPGISSENRNQIELVDQLFANLRDALDVQPQLKPVLGALQLPLAKLAILEPDFFIEPEHPARKLIDTLAQLSIAANFPNRSLAQRLQEIVAAIVADYHTDSDPFLEALREAEKLLSQQRRAVARNKEWVVRTQEGQQKLSQAQADVAQVLQPLLCAEYLPQALLDLVTGGWRDLMILTHVKDGPQSDNWVDAVAVLVQLQRWLAQPTDMNDSAIGLERELEADSFVDMIQQTLGTAVPPSIDSEQMLARLRELLTGRSPAVTATPGAPVATTGSRTDLAARLGDLPRLRRWLRQVDMLDRGTRFCYRGQEGREHTMELAWISHDRTRFVFVNERGQKHGDLSRVQLARRLARGMHSPQPADELSPVDRSLYDTLEHIQRGISRNAYRDELTGLLNRDGFCIQLQQAIIHARTRGTEHSLMVLDIDQFGIANELFDRGGGDEVLGQMARLVENEAGQQDWCARVGNDQFALVIFNRNASEARRQADGLHELVSRASIEVAGVPVTLSVSVGVAMIASPYPSAKELLHSALSGVSAAKSAGGRGTVMAEKILPDYQRHAADKSHWIRTVDNILADERLILRAQPIQRAAVNSGEDSHHYEVLVALLDESDTLCSPQEFILTAERYGYMTVIDRWVVDQTFSWIQQLMDQQQRIPQLSINISGNSITDDLFLEFLLQQIATRGIHSGLLCFEITETGTISNMVKAADFVRTLRAIGCKFSIDDFGTGMASYNYLRELPVDYVKIDGSFVSNINNNKSDYAMTRSINHLAQFLGQETIAECVESDEVAATLRDIGVNYLQGWAVGKPVLLKDLAGELADERDCHYSEVP